MNNHTAECAFPASIHFHTESGMMLLDYFAAKAMQSLILTHRSNLEHIQFTDFQIVTMAYSIADSMLTARQSYSATGENIEEVAKC